MTPQEKAKELFNKYKFILASEITYNPYYTEADHLSKCKYCALICCDEIIEVAISSHDDDHINWWKNVKNEIEKL